MRVAHRRRGAPQVIDWHERRLLPDTAGLTADPRTRLVQGDFFALARGAAGFGTGTPERFHAILLDVDHTPDHVLHPSHAHFYTAGTTEAWRYLQPGGVFALWSDDPPDDAFDILREVFPSAEAHLVSFPNPLTGGESSNSVYVAAS